MTFHLTSQASVSRRKTEAIVMECLAELYQNDRVLLQNDVSERAITHKLAEYLQLLCWLPL